MLPSCFFSYIPVVLYTVLSILLFLHRSNTFYHAYVNGMRSFSQVYERLYVYIHAFRILRSSDDGLYLGRKRLP